MKPPIASPHSSSDSFWPPPNDVPIPAKAVRVTYDNNLSWVGLIRFTAKQFFSLPICWLTAPFLLPVMPLLLPVIVVINWAMLRARGLSVTALAREGVYDVGAFLSYSIVWKRVWFVFDWNGDVSLVTFAGGSLMPREAFASRPEAREFVKIARELHKTRGASWRAEWNGKTFGVLPEKERQNLPK
jgi:hypothetical protein